MSVLTINIESHTYTVYEYMGQFKMNYSFRAEPKKTRLLYEPTVNALDISQQESMCRIMHFIIDGFPLVTIF